MTRDNFEHQTNVKKNPLYSLQRKGGFMCYFVLCLEYTLEKLVFKELLYIFIEYHTLVKDICTRFGALDHLDHLGICSSVSLARLESSDYFFCPSLYR